MLPVGPQKKALSHVACGPERCVIPSLEQSSLFPKCWPYFAYVTRPETTIPSSWPNRFFSHIFRLLSTMTKDRMAKSLSIFLLESRTVLLLGSSLPMERLVPSKGLNANGFVRCTLCWKASPSIILILTCPYAGVVPYPYPTTPVDKKQSIIPDWLRTSTLGTNAYSDFPTIFALRAWIREFSW